MLVKGVGDGFWKSTPKNCHQHEVNTKKLSPRSITINEVINDELEQPNLNLNTCVKLELLVTDLALWSSTYKCSREDPIIVTKSQV